MKTQRQSMISLAVVVAAAVVFGMVLSGGLDLTQSVGADRPEEVRNPVPAAVNFLAPDFVALADRVIPSVVSVRVTEYRSRSERGSMPQDRFHFFFGPGPNHEEDQPQARRSEGSGFFITEGGELLTNNHVIEDADTIKVELVDGSSYPAEVVGTDPATDLALLRVKDGERKFPFLPIGDSDALRVGEWVMAVGNPMDMDHTITVGVVSAKGRALGLSDRSFENYIQTDAAINFGNSGGPLVNLRGEVIGINSAINARAQNLGFAVPVKTAAKILVQLREHGRVVRGYLGVSIDNIDQKAQGAFGLDSRMGALVISVTPKSPAERAGMNHGDVIIKVDGVAIENTRTLIDTISADPPGTEVDLEVIRDGKKSRIKVTLGERDGQSAQGEDASQDEDGVDFVSERVGLSVTTLDSRTRQMYRIEGAVEGLLITRVRADSPAGEEGLTRGDLILEANGRPVKRPEDLLAEVEKIGEKGFLKLYVQRPRAQQPILLILKLED
ncbi:MAG: Do family serine endopeptidase [Thermoanaerobaculales bacterium]|nr:Do family serine endopeptidase [Thermoanaerobaculales bacterium]